MMQCFETNTGELPVRFWQRLSRPREVFEYPAIVEQTERKIKDEIQMIERICNYHVGRLREKDELKLSHNTDVKGLSGTILLDDGEQSGRPSSNFTGCSEYRTKF